MRSSGRVEVGRIAGLLIPMVLFLGAIAIWHRAHYHEWPLADHPNRFAYCGREYREEPTVNPDPDEETLHFAFRFSPLLDDHNDVYADSPIPRHRVAGQTCAVILWMRSGSGLVHYSLQGGP